MTIHGETITAGGPELGPAAAAAVLRAFDHRHEVAHLLYTAADKADAVARIGDLLNADPETVQVILEQPLGGLLPEYRGRLLAVVEAAAGVEPADERPLAIPTT